MMTLTAPDGKDVEAFAAQGAGHIDMCLRAKSRKTWDSVAKKRGLVVDTEEGLKPVPGVHIDHIGPITLEPATYYKNGKVRKKAKMDERHHVNLRLAAPYTGATDDKGNLLWQDLLLTWMRKGKKVEPNNEERAKIIYGVEMIDPGSISKPSRVWL